MIGAFMLDLFLMRHAKSSWDSQVDDDFSRPLNNRGIVAAQLMGNLFIEKSITPDLILCSDAVRTKQTLTIMIENGFNSPRIQYLHSLYHAGVETLYSAVQSSPVDMRSLMVIGHNPGLQMFAHELLNPLVSEEGTMFYTKFPTAAFAHIQFLEQNWSDIGPNSGALICYLTPKQLQSS